MSERSADGGAPRLRLIDCAADAHAEPILAILNEVIATSTALFDYEPRSLEQVRRWFADKVARFPVIGAVDEAGALLGFASYGPFRGWPAYKYTVEHSVYVARPHRGRGVGKELLRAVIDRAQHAQYHVLVAGIDGDNAASIALHRKLGFAHAGTIRQAGFKFGRWLDLAFYQRVLPTPERPIDG